MKSPEEINRQKKLYDEHYKTIEKGYEYMRSTGYAYGGWQMLAKQGLMMRNILAYVTEIAKTLGMDIKKVEDSFSQKQEPQTSLFSPDRLNQMYHASKPAEPFQPLKDVCFELSNEGYNIQWDPSQIRRYMQTYPECFQDTFEYSPSPSKKEVQKYDVRKEKLVECMAKFPYQGHSQRKLISNFAEWRKNKVGKGHC